MTFSFIATTSLVILSFFSNVFDKDYAPISTDAAQTRIIDQSQPALGSSIEYPLFLEESFDLDSDGRNEKLTIKSGVGLPGEEYTIIYLNDSQKPILHLYGFFDSINVHTMDTFRHKVVEVRVLTGQSINMLAYAYQGGDLVRIPISTEKPPNYLGIVSRNYPEFKDIDGDGILELLAYYHFLGDATRTVEVYSFKHNMFQKSGKYEEAVPSV